MKKVFLVSCLMCFNIVHIRADTNVFVRNATPFTFNVENLFNGQRSDKKMNSFSTKLEPLKMTKVVGFNRDKGITKGKAFIVTSLITSPDFKERIGLQQKMIGKIIGSKMWWGVAYPGHDTVFYDDNKDTWDKPVQFKLKDKKGRYHNFMIRAKVYEAGSFNDIEYVISGYNEPKKYTVQSTKGAPNKINILTYNTFLIEVGPFFAAPARSKRAKLMPPSLADYDVIVLNEVFDDIARKELLIGLERVGFKYSTQIVGAGYRSKVNKGNRFKMNRALKQSAVIEFDDPRFGKDTLYTQAGEGDPPSPLFRGGVLDGGVMIVSKYPISEAGEIIYGPSGGDDKNAKKGAIYARVNKEGKIYHIFGTHLQAGGYSKERVAQIKLLKVLIDAQKIPANEPVIIAGDMNINRYSKGDQGMSNGCKDMLEKLHATSSQFIGKEKFTSDPYKNSFKYKQGGATFLDYMLYSNDHQKPIKSFNEIRIFCSPKPWQPGYCDLSDHYAIYGYFEFPAK